MVERDGQERLVGVTGAAETGVGSKQDNKTTDGGLQGRLLCSDPNSRLQAGPGSRSCIFFEQSYRYFNKLSRNRYSQIVIPRGTLVRRKSKFIHNPN